MKPFEEYIEAKRDGLAHTRDELFDIVTRFVAGTVPDYQMSAWLMAVYFQGMTPDETVWLTDVMAHSGEVIDLSGVPGVKVDKHSTGGVADTTTLVVAPLVASLGVPVAKMSGRGLGHTGGTVDKLEAIPGYRVELPIEEFVGQVRSIGLAVVAQSPSIDPADKRMYALRDVTGSVPSVPLIVSSIISKKVAGGADAIVLDVKFGSGAFMRTLDDARDLARELVRVGEALGKRVSAVLTDMDQPLGDAVGNALEVREAIEVLSGAGHKDLVTVCLRLAARMLVLGGVASSYEEGERIAGDALADGRGLSKLREWLSAQGGDARCLDDLSLLRVAPLERQVRAVASGYVTGYDAAGVGRAAIALGAGRLAKDDAIDLGAGLVLAKRRGQFIEAGETLCTLYASSEGSLAEGESRFRAAVTLGDELIPDTRPLFIEA